MKSVYHFCFSSDEVMFRSDEDYVRAFNCYALALLKTESLSLADATTFFFGGKERNEHLICYLRSDFRTVIGHFYADNI